MNLRIITLLIASLAFVQVQAQKIYSTKAATVRFIAVDDKDIDATNEKAVSRLEANGKLSFIMLMKDFSFEMDLMQKHFSGGSRQRLQTLQNVLTQLPKGNESLHRLALPSMWF